MRAIQPCGAYLSLRDQLGALAARQKEGGWVALVVLHGTPEWAARPAGGCERDETMPRSRPARDMADYGRFVGAVLAEARAKSGAELRYWSPWNEPNHPYFISPQRQQCDRAARGRPRSSPTWGWRGRLAAGAGRGAGRPAARAGRAGGARRAAADDHVGLGVRRADPEGGRLRIADLDPARVRRRPRPRRRPRARAGAQGLRAARADLDHRDRCRRAPQRRGAPDDAGGPAARLRTAAPPARALVPRPARHRRLPVHVPRGRPVPDRPRVDRPHGGLLRRSPSGRRGA